MLYGLYLTDHNGLWKDNSDNIEMSPNVKYSPTNNYKAVNICIFSSNNYIDVLDWAIKNVIPYLTGREFIKIKDAAGEDIYKYKPTPAVLS